MTTSIRLPDGSTVKIATDDPQQAAVAAQKIWAQRSGASSGPAAPTASKKPLTGWETAGAFAGDVVDNILPNWGDELYGAGSATMAFLQGEDASAAFDRGQQRFKDVQKQYDEEHPYLSAASTAGGIGASLFIPAGGVLRGASLASRAVQGAKAGAIMGALSGAGEGDTLGERTGNAVRSGTIGAAGGAALDPLLTAGRAGVNLARSNIPGVDPALRAIGNVPRKLMRRPTAAPNQRAVEQADRMLAERLSQGQIKTGHGQTGAQATPDALLAEMQRRQDMNVPAMLGDLTDSTRDLVSWASRGQGPGQTRVRQALEQRKASEATRIRQHVADEFGPVGDPIKQMEDHVARARTQAAPNYQAAYAEPMVITPEIEQIMKTPAFREALPQAVKNIQNAQRDPAALGFRMLEDGTMDPRAVNTLSTEGFDQVIRAMRDSGRAAAEINPITGAVINNTNSVNINARAGDLRDQLMAQNPAYRDAVTRYADDMAHRDAFTSGQDIGKLTGHEINAQARAIPETAQRAWGMGARHSLADAASEYGARFPNGDTANHVRKMLGDETKQQAIGQLTGNTGAVRGLRDRLEAEEQANIVWKEVNGNSRTAGRQALDEALDSVAGGRGLEGLTTGRGLLSNAVDIITRGATPQFKTDVKDRIAQVVAETNPQTVAEMLQQISARAAKDREFADLLQRAGLMASRGYGAQVEPERKTD